MIDLVVLFTFFLLGFVSGITAVTTYVMFLVKRSMKKESTVSKESTLQERMKRVKDISVEQLDMSRKVEMPQRNALDGKYKNSLISKMKALDEEKITILKSILADGHDPELTTMDEAGVVTQMKLSEYMANMGFRVKPKVTSKKEKLSKFTVHKGGKDDDGGNTVH